MSVALLLVPSVMTLVSLDRELGPSGDPPPLAEATTRALRAALPAAVARMEFAPLVQATLDAAGGGPLFHDGLEPNARAKAVLARVAELDRHGMDRGPFRLGFPSEPLRALPRKRQPPIPMTPFTLERAANAAAAAEVEARLLYAHVRYVLAFRFSRESHPLEDVSDAKIAVAEHDAIVKVAAAALTEPESGLKRLWPATADYAAVQAELGRFRALVQQHGPKWPTVSHATWSQSLRKAAKGRKAPREDPLQALQARLILEGVLTGPASGAFDAATRAAVSAYRRDHGLSEDDTIDWSFTRELNRQPGSRITQLRLALARLRESRALRSARADYVRVNIPSYELRIVEGGTITRRHRVIVGNNKLDFDRNAWKQGYINRTPLLQSRMDTVVLNPVWIPPPRILDEEFEGEDHLIVPPGKRNPLGQVKFLLDRTNAVYLHDTNRRKRFEQAERALSHGCIRVHEAVALATYLLGKFAKLTPTDVERRLAAGSQDPVDLDRELAVYVEYVTADVGADGRVRLLPDVYGYDAAWLAGRRAFGVQRYGAGSLRPKSVPVIPEADYRRLKAAGDKAPVTWPVAATP